jgi:hypothetical protein
MVWGCELDSYGSGEGPAEGFGNLVMNLWFHKGRGISWLADWLLASQEGFCSMDSVADRNGKRKQITGCKVAILFLDVMVKHYTNTHIRAVLAVCTRAVWKIRGLTLLLRVGTLWRCNDSLFFEVPPFASDALLTTLHPCSILTCNYSVQCRICLLEFYHLDVFHEHVHVSARFCNNFYHSKLPVSDE